jgi:hypothetical protein
MVVERSGRKRERERERERGRVPLIDGGEGQTRHNQSINQSIIITQPPVIAEGSRAAGRP